MKAQLKNVKWSYYCTPTEEEISTHYDGNFKAIVSDCDGDMSVWSVHKRLENGDVEQLAHGEIYDTHAERYHADLAKEIALAALAAFKATRRSRGEE